MPPRFLLAGWPGFEGCPARVPVPASTSPTPPSARKRVGVAGRSRPGPAPHASGRYRVAPRPSEVRDLPKPMSKRPKYPTTVQARLRDPEAGRTKLRQQHRDGHQSHHHRCSRDGKVEHRAPRQDRPRVKATEARTHGSSRIRLVYCGRAECFGSLAPAIYFSRKRSGQGFLLEGAPSLIVVKISCQ